MQETHTQMLAGIEPGALLAGKYRVERKIGEGGMGVVVVARHLELDELVAIKVLLPDAQGNPEAVMRFSREARASVKIKSEHVARTLDVGKLDNGVAYMVMEYLQGTDLDVRLQEFGPLPIEQAIDFTLQTCHALADAHVMGIIHRDVKPSNLFVVRKSDGNESIKVLDFGISKITGAAAGTDMSMTRTQTLMGSPHYMSPEQMASSRNAGESVDIWALGVTLHELITGRAPFDGETITELCNEVLKLPPPRLLQWRQDVPPGLQAVVDRCLEKEPANRYQNVAEFAVALAPYGTDQGQLSAEATRRVLQGAGMSPSGDPNAGTPKRFSTNTVASWSQTYSHRKRRNKLWMGTIISVLSIGAIASAMVIARARMPPTSSVVAVPLSQPAAVIGSSVAGMPAVSVSPAILLVPEPAAIAVIDTNGKLFSNRAGIKATPSDSPPAVGRGLVALPKRPQKLKNRRQTSETTDFGGRVF
jgi:eukaryotic-like serine/threonine-protein kinase